MDRSTNSRRKRLSQDGSTICILYISFSGNDIGFPSFFFFFFFFGGVVLLWLQCCCLFQLAYFFRFSFVFILCTCARARESWLVVMSMAVRRLCKRDRWNYLVTITAIELYLLFFNLIWWHWSDTRTTGMPKIRYKSFSDETELWITVTSSKDPQFHFGLSVCFSCFYRRSSPASLFSLVLNRSSLSSPSAL